MLWNHIRMILENYWVIEEVNSELIEGSKMELSVYSKSLVKFEWVLHTLQYRAVTKVYAKAPAKYYWETDFLQIVPHQIQLFTLLYHLQLNKNREKEINSWKIIIFEYYKFYRRWHFKSLTLICVQRGRREG